ncbi:glycoside hydrolase domain-containing protein [Naumannella halotolerans]|uniref:glycoside hydrolase domain-containing protein n=1 Tax=Naumannella halotolerans TaxID=993414 RepID=UPI00370D1022
MHRDASIGHAGAWPRAEQAGNYSWVDPFIGTAATDLPDPVGLAATWWWPKPQVGNTHPGATYPLGMVSACAYSGGYPTGYSNYALNTEGVPVRLGPAGQISGFTHFQQSGTGAIRKYYNYFRVTPMVQPLDALGDSWRMVDEAAQPGWYGTRLTGVDPDDPGSMIDCELTVGPKSAVHRYTFGQAHRDARVVIDFSHGGLEIPHGETVPLRAHLEIVSPNVAQGEVVVEGVPLSVHIECDVPGWRQTLWYDQRLMQGGTRLDFDYIRATTLRSFGLMWRGPAVPGQQIEVRIGFSLRGVEQARANLYRDCGGVDELTGTIPPSFDARRAETARSWSDHLDLIEIDSDDAGVRTIFSTALYHSLIKPCLALNESPLWPMNSPFAFDLSTMWDIYRTQLPLLTTVLPERAVELGIALLHICENEGNLPIGYRMAKGADRFARQGSALAHPFLADLCQLGLSGVDWDWALCFMDADFRRSYGEEYMTRGLTHPISHTLDLAHAFHCTAIVAEYVGDHAGAARYAELAQNWRNAFDPETGLLRDSTYYEGGKWNYSFRLVHDMASRIELSGGDEAYTALLDAFFGYGAEPVTQPGQQPGIEEMAAGYALNRFEGLNNEPDLDAPWAYHYTGRPDRTAEIIQSAWLNQFGTGAGGLPGNDDSGGLSSWYVWATLGLFPVTGQSRFLINTPNVRAARLRVPGGLFEITTQGFRTPSRGGPYQYVQEAWLNGQLLQQTWIDAADVRRGGRLDIELGPEPSEWGRHNRPPSIGLHSAVR